MRTIKSAVVVCAIMALPFSYVAQSDAKKAPSPPTGRLSVAEFETLAGRDAENLQVMSQLTRDIAEQHDDLLCTAYAEFPTNQGTTAFEHDMADAADDASEDTKFYGEYVQVAVALQARKKAYTKREAQSDFERGAAKLKAYAETEYNRASDIEIAYDDLKALKCDEVQIALGQAATNADLGESYFKQWTKSLGQAVKLEPPR
jgi:hypothetical protein